MTDGYGGDSLGQASGSINLEADQALASLKQVSAGIRQMGNVQPGAGFGNVIRQYQDHLNTLGTAIGGFGAVVLGAFGVATNTTMNFQAQISAVGSVAGATREEVAALSDEALRLGASTTFGATEAAQGMEIMLKSGASLTDVLNGGTEAVLNLATATGDDLLLSAETATTGVNLFGKSYTKVADTITQSSNASALGVNDWALALKSAGPVAQALGVDIDEFSASLMIMSDAGITGETAGTALRNTLMNLSDTTSEGSKALADLGISVYDAQGNFRGLEAITSDLVGSWGDMTQEQRMFLAEQVAGKDGAAAFLAVMDAQTEAASRNSDAFTEANARSAETGTTAEQAAARVDNLKGSFERLGGILETIQIRFMSGLTPSLRAVVDGLSALGEMVLRLPPAFQTFLAAATGIVGVLATLTGGALLMLPKILAIKDAFVAIRPAIMAARVAMMGFLGPVAIITAIGAAVYLAYKHWEPFRRVVDQAAAALRKFAVVKIVPFLKDVMKSIERIGDAFSFYKDRTDLVSASLKSLAAVFPGLRGAINPVLAVIDQFKRAFESLRGQGLNPVQAALGAVAQMFPVLGGFLSNVGNAVQAFTDHFRAMWEAITAFAQGEWAAGFSALGEAIVSLVEGVGNLMLAVPRLIYDTFRAIDWGAVGSVLWSGAVAAFNRIVDAVRSIDWGAVGRALVSGLQSAVGWLIGVGQMLWDKGGELIGGLLNGISERWETVKSWISDNITKSTISTAIGAAGEWLKDKGRAILIGLYNGVNGYWGETIKPWFQELKGKVTGFIIAPYTWLLNAGKQIIQGLKAGLLSAWTEVKSWFQGILDWIDEKVTWITDKIAAIGDLLGISTGGNGGAGEGEDDDEGSFIDPPPDAFEPKPGGSLNIDTAAARLQIGLLGESFAALKAAFDISIPPIGAGFGTAVGWPAAPLAALASIKSGFATTLPALVVQSQTSFSAAKAAAVSNIDGMKASVGASISTMSSSTISTIGAMNLKVIDRASNMSSTVKTAFMDMNTAAATQTSIMNTITGAAFSTMRSNASSAMNAMRSAVSSGMAGVVAAVRSGMSSAVAAASGMSGSFYGAGADAIQGLVNGARSRLGALQSVVSQAIAIMARIPSLGNSPWPMMIGAGHDALDGLIQGVAERHRALGRVIDATIQYFSEASPIMQAELGMSRYQAGLGFSSPAYQTIYSAPHSPVINHYITHEGDTTTVLTIPPDEWVRVAKQAEDAPARTAALMQKARSIVVEGEPSHG